jgi:hypothetical protein
MIPASAQPYHGFKAVRNFLGLLARRCERFHHLSPELYPLLNDKMKSLFETAIGEMIKRSSLQPKRSCFICFNVDERDVKEWLLKALIPDLINLGVKPVCSLTDFKGGTWVTPFMAGASATDYVLVICTPELNAKRSIKGSGIAKEIGHLEDRFKMRKETTIAVYFKGEFGEYNPLDKYTQNPFAIHAPWDNYTGILEVFTTLRNLERDFARTRIENITVKTIEYLDDLLHQQAVAIFDVFVACREQIKTSSRSSRIPSCCVLYDGQYLTSDWIKKYLRTDFQEFNIKESVVSSTFQSITDLSSKVDFVFVVYARALWERDCPAVMKRATNLLTDNDPTVLSRRNSRVFQLLLDGPSPVEKNPQDHFLITSDESYFRAALTIFAYMHEFEFDIQEFENRKNALIHNIHGNIAPLQTEFQQRMESELRGMKAKMAAIRIFQKDDQIPLYESKGKTSLEKLDFESALDSFWNAYQYSIKQRGDQDPSTLALLLQCANIKYRLGLIDAAFVNYTTVNKVDEELQEANHHLGRLYHIKKELENAEVHFQVAMSSGHHSGVIVDYSNLLFCHGRFEEMIPLLTQLILMPDDDVMLTYGRCDIPALPDELRISCSSNLIIS